MRLSPNNFKIRKSAEGNYKILYICVCFYCFYYCQLVTNPYDAQDSYINIKIN